MKPQCHEEGGKNDESCAYSDYSALLRGCAVAVEGYQLASGKGPCWPSLKFIQEIIDGEFYNSIQLKSFARSSNTFYSYTEAGSCLTL
jgi:hypothetical protein